MKLDCWDVRDPKLGQITSFLETPTHNLRKSSKNDEKLPQGATGLGRYIKSTIIRDVF